MCINGPTCCQIFGLVFYESRFWIHAFQSAKQRNVSFLTFAIFIFWCDLDAKVRHSAQIMNVFFSRNIQAFAYTVRYEDGDVDQHVHPCRIRKAITNELVCCVSHVLRKLFLFVFRLVRRTYLKNLKHLQTLLYP